MIEISKCHFLLNQILPSKFVNDRDIHANESCNVYLAFIQSALIIRREMLPLESLISYNLQYRS